MIQILARQQNSDVQAAADFDAIALPALGVPR